MLAEWKRQQVMQGVAPGTVTNRVVKINHFLRYMGLDELCFQNGGRQNLTGMRFGNLIAVEPLKERTSDRSVYWKSIWTREQSPEYRKYWGLFPVF